MATGVYKITDDFEKALSDYTGAPYVVTVDNQSNALFLALMYEKVKGKVIKIPSRTYPSVPCEIIHAGLKVKFKQVKGKTIEGVGVKNLYYRNLIDLIDGKKKIKTIGTKVCPKSSPLFQEFKIWQILNNIEVSHKTIKEKRTLELEEKQRLFNELSINEKLSKNAVLKLLFAKPTELDLNFKENTEGNRTNASLFEAYKKIAIISGHEIDFLR